jgi:hypothetical protein
MGLWRRGSAPPWHGGGRGFESRQLHQRNYHLLIKNTLSVGGFLFACGCNGDGSCCTESADTDAMGTVPVAPELIAC